MPPDNDAADLTRYIVLGETDVAMALAAELTQRCIEFNHKLVGIAEHRISFQPDDLSEVGQALAACMG